MLEKVYRQLHTLLPPEPCALCSTPTDGEPALCPGCREKLPTLQQIPHELQQNPHWEKIIIPYRYSDPLSPLIQQLKFDHRLHLARLFGTLMVAALQQERINPPDRILPVPLHTKRLRQRGFNQALEIIRTPARALGVPIDRSSCNRVVHTDPQAGLKASARRENLREAFTVTRPLNGESIALFDDVITTGSTIRAVSDALREGGAGKIQVWALAYTPPHT